MSLYTIKFIVIHGVPIEQLCRELGLIHALPYSRISNPYTQLKKTKQILTSTLEGKKLISWTEHCRVQTFKKSEKRL